MTRAPRLSRVGRDIRPAHHSIENFAVLASLSPRCISVRYAPTGHPLVGLLIEKAAAKLSASATSVASSILVSLGAAAPTSSAIQTARKVSPLWVPVDLKNACSCVTSDPNFVAGRVSASFAI